MRSFRFASLVAFALAGSFAASHSAHAQLPAARAERVPAFGRNAVSVEDTTALVVNPANLAFLPGPELRWTGVFLNEQATVPWQGHQAAMGTRIPWTPLATSLRVDWLLPPSGYAFSPSVGSAQYQWLTWGLAARLGNTSAIGATLQRSFSEDPGLHGFSSWSAGITSRPSDYFGLAVVGQDLNSPVSRGGERHDRSYNFALAVRPLKSRAVELGLEAKYVDSFLGAWVPRATLGVDIPTLGRLSGDLAYTDLLNDRQERSWLASVKLSIYLNGQNGSLELGAGSVFGDALGFRAQDRAHENLVTEAAIRGYRDPAGIDGAFHALRVRIESRPSDREHVALLRSLWRIAEKEPSTAAVVLEIREEPASSLAHVQELRDAVSLLKTRGKRVICHLENAAGPSLYLCSAADRILMQPNGVLNFAGLRMRHLYFKNLLEKVGIRTDFVRSAEHKTAPEMTMREGASDVARADYIDQLQHFEKHFILGVSRGRGIPVDELRARIAKGPFTAEEAKRAGLIDALAFNDQEQEQVNRLLGVSDLPLLDNNPGPTAPAHFGNARRVAIVYVDGTIADGRSRSVPLLGMQVSGSYTLAETFKQLRDDPRVGAVVLRLDSGGGSSLGSDVIWREIRLTTAVKPVIVSMGTIAASGAYLLASAGSRVFANPSSVTGSIGVFFPKFDVVELLRKLGINAETYTTAPHADAASMYHPLTDEERGILLQKVLAAYDIFLDRVAEGRRLPKAKIHDVGQGRVWVGEQAQQNGLVDELGGLRQALEFARKAADMPDYSPIQEVPVPESSLIGKLLGIESEMPSFSLNQLPGPWRTLVNSVGPLLVFPEAQNLSLIELAPFEP